MSEYSAEDWKSLAMENERSVHHWIAKFDALQSTLTAQLDEAVRLARVNALEEAAKVAENQREACPQSQPFGVACFAIAFAIRALASQGEADER